MEKEIPINNPEEDAPFLDEINEEIVDQTPIDDKDIIDEEYGGYNELPLNEEIITPTFNVGNTYIILLESRNDPFLAKVIEIIIGENLLKMEDDMGKLLSFQFELNEIIMETENYKILDMIRVKLYEPEKEKEIKTIDIEFDVDELLNKKYSEYAIKDDLLSAMIQSMNVYDKPIMIEYIQEIVDNFLELSLLKKKGKLLFPKWLIPIIEDDLKTYDYLGFILENEIKEEKESLNDSTNYREYLLSSLRYSKPIETKTGYGLETNEYSGTYLRNCLQNDSCSGLLGPYRYDERINNKSIIMDNEIILPSNQLRIIGFLEEPLNINIYSVNYNTLSVFTLFEKYIYDFLNKKNNLNKKERINNSLIISTDDDSEVREKDKFILHSLPNDCNLDIINDYRKNCYNELISLLLDDDIVKESLYNYDDINHLLFKYELSYEDILLSDRNKINSLISKNIKDYKKQYGFSNKVQYNNDINLVRSTLTDEKRVMLSYDKIFSLSKREERNYYLQYFIDLFTRPSDKETESCDYLYNKYTNEKVLCKHYLYEVNISDSNDIFNTMKSKFGAPAEDGYISCRICGGYLCHEDTTIFDGYNDDKPIITREVMEEDKEKELEISKTLEDSEEAVKIIKNISNSLGISLLDNDIYNILLSYELLDHNILPDIRYGIKDTSINDKHPRIIKEIERIKSEEKAAKKDKIKRKELKEERENIMKKFQTWLKNTNKILFLAAVTSLYIQTAIPALLDKNKSFELLNIESKKINISSLKYLSAKLKKLSDKYKNETIWNNVMGLFNEKEYGTNEIETQLKLTLKYCMEPNFPKIIDRITKLEEYIESEKHQFLKEEWITFKPLQNNILVKNISNYLSSVEEENLINLRRVYGSITVENNSLIRTKTQSYDKSISEVLEIPEIEIFKNNSFKKLFRYAVSLYGIHPSNIFITLTCQRLLNTCNKKSELLTTFIKNGWNEKNESFKELNFKKIRTNLIPDILSIYGDKNTDINSCYSNEKSCNDFIHNAINTYDLPLLNTLPKRIYIYKIPIIYPELPYGRLKEIERYDEEGERQKNVIEKIFEVYKKDEMGDIIKDYNDDFYLQFYAKLSLSDYDIINMNKFKKIEKNEENYLDILKTINKLNSLSDKEFIKKKLIYMEEDYNRIDIISKLDIRFYEYIELFNEMNIDKNKDIIYSNLLKILNNILIYDKSPAVDDKINLELKDCFSDILYEMEENIRIISKFISESDEIRVDQKKRFESIFKEYNPTERISFTSKNITSILTLFIMDPNLKYNHLVGYINDIRNIFSRLNNMNNIDTKLPKEWKCTDNINNELKKFMNRNNNSVYLYLHNNIYMKTKDNYHGFNSYINDNDDNKKYFQLLYNKINHYFINLDKIKGSNNSKYNNKYSSIYIKYHFIGIFYEIITIINDLKDSQSDITSDANDLFQSLERRDEDLIDDMIEVLSQFVIDLLTHILFQHYDPTWLFLNEQKLDLANRLSKQKEKEKQTLLEKFDIADKDKRFAMIQNQKMGISNWHKESSEKANEYIKSEEYSNHTEDERYERLKLFQSKNNIELDVLNCLNDNDEIQDIPESAILVEEGEDNLQDIEIDEENEEYQDEYLDDEQEQIYNE